MTANPSGQTGRRIGAGSWPAAVQGGPGSPACHTLAPRGHYGLRHLAQKIMGVGVMLTVGLWWPELRSMEVVGEVRRRDVA